jgi:protein required for attachment to host cells
MKPVRSLILIANDDMARFFVNEGVGKGMSEKLCISRAQFRAEAVGHDDRPGRAFGGPGGMARHAFDRRQDEDDLERERFAQHVVEALESEWRALAPDRLFVAAAPRMLGALRVRIPRAQAAAMTGELAKDLVPLPAAELPAHFEGLLAL